MQYVLKPEGLAGLVRDSRRALGLSQMTVARGSGLSLPFIQQIESGRANPSLESLRSILAVFGFELKATCSTNWPLLAALGLPLLENRASEIPPAPSRADLLLRELRAACRELSVEKRAREGDARKEEALRALILALHDGYPTWYRKHCGSSPLIERFRPLPVAGVDGRLIKLRRLCLARLGEYL